MTYSDGYRMSIPQPRAFDAERVKKNAFDEGILVVKLDDPRIAWPERQMLKQVGERIYGRPGVQRGRKE